MRFWVFNRFDLLYILGQAVTVVLLILWGFEIYAIGFGFAFTTILWVAFKTQKEDKSEDLVWSRKTKIRKKRRQE